MSYGDRDRRQSRDDWGRGDGRDDRSRDRYSRDDRGGRGDSRGGSRMSERDYRDAPRDAPRDSRDRYERSSASARDMGDSRDGRDRRERDSRDSRDPRSSRDPRDSRDSRDGRSDSRTGSRDSRDTRRDPRDPRESRERDPSARSTRDSRDSRSSRDSREARPSSSRDESRGSRDGRDPRDTRDSRDSRKETSRPRDSRDRSESDRKDSRSDRSRRESTRDMAPPPGRDSRGMAPPRRESTRERTRDRSRSMTYEAPPINPEAPVENILCQACAEVRAAVVCYNCSEAGALYCDGCYDAIHADESMAGHSNKGPLLRCKRGDCTGKCAEYWCSICTDVCSGCATQHCSNHRDGEAVLIRAGTKNKEMLQQQQQVMKHEEESDSESEQSNSKSSSSSSESSTDDELVQTWGRAEKRLEIKGPKSLKSTKSPWELAGLPNNPLAGRKMPDGGRVGQPPLPRSYTCDYCRQDIEFMRQRYRCTECTDPHYDLCQQCFDTVKHKHEEMLYIIGFNLQVVTLPSALKNKQAKERADERDRGDRPDSCCYICGGTGHFAKECKNRRKLEGGEAVEVRIRPEEPEDGVSIAQCLGITAKPELTDEERLAKGLVDMQRLKERVVRLAKLRKRKHQRKKGMDVDGDDTVEQAELLMGVQDLAPTIVKQGVVREPTPELESIPDDVYAEQIGAPPPRIVDDLLKFDSKEIYDAALEKPQGAKVPAEAATDQDWDQEYFEKFEEALSRVNDPLYSSIDGIVRREAMKNKSRHLEIMCAVETRLQSEKLKPLQKLATWFVLDALFKQAGGYFIFNIKDNLVTLVQSFLPVVQINDNWRTRTRDMLRSWRDILEKKDVDTMLRR